MGAQSQDSYLKKWQDELPDSRVDRVVYVLFVFAAYLTLLSFLAAWSALLVYPIRLWFHLTAGWLLIPPLLLDLSSAYMHVAYMLKRTRAHGQAGLAWFYYVGFSLWGGMAWYWGVAMLIGFSLLHIGCQRYIPLAIAKRLGWRSEPEGYSG